MRTKRSITPQRFLCLACSVLSFLLINSLDVLAGDLVFSTQTPTVNSVVQFSYKPDSAWALEKNLYVFIYRFKEVSGEPKADYTKLTRGSDGIWRGELTVGKTDVYWIAKVYNGKRSDDNKGLYWEAIVTTDGTTPVQGAKLRAGITYLGALPENCSRAANFQRAQTLMQEELKLYPNNLSAKIAETSLAFELKTISSDEHQKRMKQFLATPFDTARENDTRAVIRVLNTIGQPQESQTLKQKFMEKFPGSGMKEEYLMWQMQNTQNPQFFVDRVKEYHQFFPTSPNLPMLQANAIAAHKEIGKLRSASAWLDSLQNSSALAYNELAKFTLRYDSSEKDAAIRYAQKALDLARQNRIYTRPPQVTEIEWNQSTASTVGDMYNTLATLYFEQSRHDEALTTFYKALEATRGELPSQAYAQAAMLLMLKKDFQEALRISSQGTVMNVGGDNVLMKWHRAAMDSVLGVNSANVIYTEERARLVDSSQIVNAYRQFLQRLDYPIIPGTYFNVDKKSFSMENLNGKVTLLVFMSSWAEPCEKMIPYINVLFKKYANSGVVNFVVIDTWEDRSTNRYKTVRDFMKKYPSLNFPIYVDDNDQLAQKYGVMGVPMRFYIDKLGRIQYKASGYEDSAKLVQEIENTLNLLLMDKFYYFQ